VVAGVPVAGVTGLVSEGPDEVGTVAGLPVPVEPVPVWLAAGVIPEVVVGVDPTTEEVGTDGTVVSVAIRVTRPRM